MHFDKKLEEYFLSQFHCLAHCILSMQTAAEEKFKNYFKVFRFLEGIQVDDETHWAGFTHHNLTIPLHKRVPQVDVFPADH